MGFYIKKIAKLISGKSYTFFFIRNQFAKGMTLKNGLKVKQLAKQPC